MRGFKSLSVMIILTICLIFGGFATTALAADKAPDKIKVGQAIALSGKMAMTVANLEKPVSDLWVQEVNKKGGLYIPEYDKRIPIELIRYDTASDVDTTVKLVKKLITVDKVDFLLPSNSSDFQFAMLPIANQHGYPQVTWTCAIEKLYGNAEKMPYVFHCMADYKQRYDVLKDMFVELGVKSVAVIYIQGVMGIEISKHFVPACEKAGIEVVMSNSYPFGSTDLSPLLKKIKAANPDATVAISYPQDTMLITEQSMVIGLNPKVFFVDIGGAFPFYLKKFGAAKLEGVMTEGGWSPKLSPEAQYFYDEFKKLNGKPPDFFSAPYGYATFQVLEQAIEKAGLDRDKVRDVIAETTFDTVNGPVRFVGQINDLFPSAIGQWQNGVLMAVAPKDKRAAKIEYPKPDWP